MNKNRIINLIVLFLLAVGVVLVGETILELSPNEAFQSVSKIGKYASLPLGVSIKLFQYLDNKFKKMEEIKEIALTNKRNDDSLKEQIRFIRDDFISSRVESTESLSELDRRMIRLEARSELSLEIERLGRMVREQNERINKLCE